MSLLSSPTFATPISQVTSRKNNHTNSISTNSDGENDQYYFAHSVTPEVLKKAAEQAKRVRDELQAMRVRDTNTYAKSDNDE